MLATIPNHRSSGSEISAYARPFWEKATGYGTENATTSFHLQYNKRDINRVRGKNDRYTGERAMSIGYMKGGVKMMKFLTSDEGRSLVGVDCSKPGSGGQARQDRIRSVGDEFLALAAYYSKKREYERGDIEAVAEARDMDPSTFATFVGFSYAIVSPEFRALKSKWYNEEQAELTGQQPQVAPVSQATPLAVVVGVEVPPSAAPAAAPERPPRDPRVVDMDSSEDEEEEDEELPAAPPPPPAPPLPLPAYNEQTHQLFKLMIKVLLRDPVTEEASKPELRDLANTIDGMSYPAHMRRVQQLIGAPRLGEIMRALEAGAAASVPAPVHVDDNGIETIPTVVLQSGHEESVNVRINTPEQHRAQASGPDPDFDASVALAMQLQEEEDSLAASASARAAAPAAAPVEEQDSEEVLNRKIFGNDDDDAASDRSVSPVVMPDEVCDGLPDMHEERKRLEAEQRREAAAAAALAAAKPASERTVRFAAAPMPANGMPDDVRRRIERQRADAQRLAVAAAKGHASAKPMPKPIPKPAVPAAKPKPQAKATKRAAPAKIQPPQGPRKKQAPSPAVEATPMDADMNSLGMEILDAFGEAKKAHKTNVYESIFTIMNVDKPLYQIVTKRRKDGKSAGLQDTEAVIKPPLSKTIGKTRLRSVPNIKTAFGLS
jgi:hypothetical protein